MTSAKEQFEKERDDLARSCEARDGGDCLSQLTQPGTKYGEHIHVFCECDVIEGFQQGYTAALSSSVVRELAKSVKELLINEGYDTTGVGYWDDVQEALSNLASIRGKYE